MRRVTFTETAQSDLEEIWWYIAQDNPDRADSFVDELSYFVGADVFLAG